MLSDAVGLRCVPGYKAQGSWTTSILPLTSLRYRIGFAVPVAFWTGQCKVLRIQSTGYSDLGVLPSCNSFFGVSSLWISIDDIDVCALCALCTESVENAAWNSFAIPGPRRIPAAGAVGPAQAERMGHFKYEM